MGKKGLGERVDRGEGDRIGWAGEGDRIGWAGGRGTG